MLQLPTDVIDRLTSRINDEWKAVQFYQSAQMAFTRMNYDVIASFCEGEMKDELGHAKTLQDFLSDYDVYVTRDNVELNHNFTDPKDFVQQALEIESALEDAYNDDFIALEQYPNVQNLLLGFLTIQTDSVREYLNKQRKLSTLTSEFEFRTLESVIFN